MCEARIVMVHCRTKRYTQVTGAEKMSTCSARKLYRVGDEEKDDNKKILREKKYLEVRLSGGFILGVRAKETRISYSEDGAQFLFVDIERDRNFGVM